MSKIARVYADLIKEGYKQLENIPDDIKEEVKEILEKEMKINECL